MARRPFGPFFVFAGILHVRIPKVYEAANLHMALNPGRCPKVPGGRAGLIARLPVQAVLVAWALAASRG